MRPTMHLKLVLLILSLSAGLPMFCQVAPDAENKTIPISIGAGFSSFYTDWSGYENGPVAWIDWHFHRLPPVLDGLGVEAEGRDLNYGRTGDIPDLRESTVGGGVIYTFHQIPAPNFHLYGKYLIDYGRAYVASPSLHIVPQAKACIVHAPGVGVEVRAWRTLWVRGDYEWQFWPGVPNVPGHTSALTPRGLTIGASYHLPGIGFHNR
jgi:hypothetical protein